MIPWRFFIKTDIETKYENKYENKNKYDSDDSMSDINESDDNDNDNDNDNEQPWQIKFVRNNVFIGFNIHGNKLEEKELNIILMIMKILLIMI